MQKKSFLLLKKLKNTESDLDIVHIDSRLSVLLLSCLINLMYHNVHFQLMNISTRCGEARRKSIYTAGGS